MIIFYLVLFIIKNHLLNILILNLAKIPQIMNNYDVLRHYNETIMKLWRHYDDTMTTLWRHYDDTMASLWRHYGVTLTTLWRHYGDPRHYGVTMTTLWRHYGVTMTTLWRHYGVTMTTLWCHYGVTMAPRVVYSLGDVSRNCKEWVLSPWQWLPCERGWVGVPPVPRRVDSAALHLLRKSVC